MKTIIASSVKSATNGNQLWAVTITGESRPKAFCKTPYKAMRLMFLLKSKTGIDISENCLSRLSSEISRAKAQTNPATPI